MLLEGIVMILLSFPATLLLTVRRFLGREKGSDVLRDIMSCLPRPLNPEQLNAEPCVAVFHIYDGLYATSFGSRGKTHMGSKGRFTQVKPPLRKNCGDSVLGKDLPPQGHLQES